MSFQSRSLTAQVLQEDLVSLSSGLGVTVYVSAGLHCGVYRVIPRGSAAFLETLTTEFMSEPSETCLPENVMVRAAGRP